jgi:hypothetical protein
VRVFMSVSPSVTALGVTVGNIAAWLPLWKFLGSNLYLKTSFPGFYNEFTPSYT